MKKYQSIEDMPAEEFKAMVLRCIKTFDEKPIDKTRPFGMAAAALFIAHGCEEMNATEGKYTLRGCTRKNEETGDWQVVVRKLVA